MTRWGSRHELEVVWLVFVVTRNVECLYTLKEYFGDRAIAGKYISTDLEQLACGRVWAALVHRLMDDHGIETLEWVEPFLDFIPGLAPSRV